MNLFQKAVKSLAKIERVKEVLLPEFTNAAGLSIDPDENLYRRISQFKRDLDPISHERAIAISYYLYEVNGFFRRLIDIPWQAIEQAGIDIVTEDEAIQERWNEFWEDETFGWKNTFFEEYREIKLSGEGVWPVAQNPINGDLELGYLDPLNVKTIRMVPGNVKIPDKVIEKNSVGQEGRTWNIIRPIAKVLKGEAFYFGINKPINSSRGRPELMHILDHIDLYDQLVFSEAERGMLKKSFVWDVTLKEAKEGDILEWYKKNFRAGDAPKPGSVRAHNEKEEWKEVTPSLDAADSTEMVRTLRQNVAGSGGYPDFFFGWGGDTNVATAREMLKPTIWMIQAEQKRIIKIIKRVFAYQLQLHSGTKQTLDGMFRDMGQEWSLKANNVFPRDYVLQSAAFRDNVATIAVGITQNLWGKEVGRRMAVHVANEFGFELDQAEVDEEFERMEQEEPEIPEPTNGDIGTPLDKPMTISELVKQSKHAKKVRRNGKYKKVSV